MIYLYVKEHTITGKKYFGKCTTRHPLNYPGSGMYWTRHIGKHGKKNVITTQIWKFTSQEEATKFALQFSEENQIVDSDAWANLIPENALDGGVAGVKFSDEHKKKITKSLLGRTYEVKERIRLSNIGKKHTEETKEILRKAATGKVPTDKTKEKISLKLKEAHIRNPKVFTNEWKERISLGGIGRTHSTKSKERIGNAHRNKIVSTETKLKQAEKAKSRTLTCPHCKTTANAVTIRRWHNDKCKSLSIV